MWAWLTRTALKAQLWSYFDSETDFGRQLEGFGPNAKFEPELELEPAAGGATAAVAEEGGAGAEVRSLAALVTRAKVHEGVARVYCWHALHGYWRGVSGALGARAGLPVVQAAPRPSRHLLTLEPQVAWPVSRVEVTMAIVDAACLGPSRKSRGTLLLHPAPPLSLSLRYQLGPSTSAPHPLPTTPQVAWDTPALFGVGLVEDEASAGALYRALHTPLAAAGVDGVKVRSLVITPIDGVMLPPCVV